MRTFPRSLKYRIAVAVAFFALAAFLTSQPAPREQVGPLPGGAFLLNSGWRLDPAGRQVLLDTLPMSTALSPDGKYLLVRSEEHTSELQSLRHLVCRLL